MKNGDLWLLIFSQMALLMILNVLLIQDGSRRQEVSDNIVIVYDVIELVNENRLDAGLSALEEDRNLSDECLAWSVWMNRVGKLRHCKGVNECIAFGQTSPSEVVDDWMASDGHRALILTDGWTRIGVGRSGKYWTMRFERN